MTRLRATFGILMLAAPLCGGPARCPRAPRPARLFRRPRPGPPAGPGRRPLARRRPGGRPLDDRAGPLPATAPGPTAAGPDAFQWVLDRMGDANDRPRPAAAAPGLIVDPGRWRYKQETAGDLFRRTTKLEVPDPQEVWVPYGGRNWKAQEKVQIPVPISVPLAEQLFVYGQFDGSGDP